MDILVFQMWLYFMVLHPQNDDMPIVFEEKNNLPYMFKFGQNFSQIVMNQNSKLQDYVS